MSDLATQVELTADGLRLTYQTGTRKVIWELSSQMTLRQLQDVMQDFLDGTKYYDMCAEVTAKEEPEWEAETPETLMMAHQVICRCGRLTGRVRGGSYVCKDCFKVSTSCECTQLYQVHS
jgi:hypothetical protein